MKNINEDNKEAIRLQKAYKEIEIIDIKVNTKQIRSYRPLFK